MAPLGPVVFLLSMRRNFNFLKYFSKVIQSSVAKNPNKKKKKTKAKKPTTKTKQKMHRGQE